MFSQEGYSAARSGVALAERVDRGVIRVAGVDAASWLQGLLTNDVAALRPGECCYAAYLTPQGRMITDARVLRQAGASGTDGLLLDVPLPLVASLVPRLDALVFAEDVRIEDAHAAMAVLELHGPGAPAVRERLAAPGDSAAAPDLIRDDQYGVPGYAVHVPVERRDEVAALLRAAGAVDIDLGTLNVVRVESGCPLFLADMNEDIIPLEAGIEDRAISFTKGCYVGQEIIVRVTQRGGGRVAKKLVGLTCPTSVEASSAAALVGAAVRGGDRDIGRITSAVWSPALVRVIALGYVHRDFLAPGTVVRVATDDAGIDAVVTEVPFHGTTP